MGGPVMSYALAFPAIFVLAWLSQALAGNAVIKEWGPELPSSWVCSSAC